MKKRGYGILSFEQIKNLDEDINISVNRSFLDMTYAKYNAKRKYELTEIMLPYITDSSEDNEQFPMDEIELTLSSRYIEMPTQDAKKIFCCLSKKDFWPNAFRVAPQQKNKINIKSV